MFIGKSLMNIRILNEYSRAQLADKLDITEQAIWQYENGYVTPKLEIINKMKILFDVKSTYFFKEDLIEQENSNNIHIERIAYRSDTINVAMKTQSECMHMEYLDAILNKVIMNLHLPSNQLVELRSLVLSYLNENQDLNRDEQISQVANTARNYLKIPKNSNENLVFYLEKAGAFIIEKPIGEKIDAYSLWSERDRPYIVLGNLKKSSVRRNFDLAHELGHLLLHYKTEFNMLDKSQYKVKEDEAHKFAAEFLMPKELFLEDIGKVNRISNPDSYIELKKKWLVSIQAMALRANSLDKMTYQQLRYFYMSINKKGYKSLEPLDKEIPIEKPMKFQSILQLVFEKRLLVLEDLLDELRITIDFLIKITGIPASFFEKYERNVSKKFSINDLSIVD